MQKQVGNYLLIGELGKGQFGSVFKGLDTSDNNKEYAVKQVSRSKVESSPVIMKLFRSEIEVMRIIDHPNLLKLKDYLETSSNFYVVVQYCKDGDMEKFLTKVGKISEEQAVFYLKQIAAGFFYMVKKKIMHRDFKLANIFMNGHEIVIGDFGFAKAGVEATMTKLGTPYNMSPELIFSTGTTKYTNKTDLWSIGVVYFQLLFGRLPFQVMTLDELKHQVRYKSGKNLSFPPGTSISSESQQLLIGLLEYDPSKRISWNEFFNHPLFEKFKEFGPAKSVIVDQSAMYNSLHHMTPRQQGREAQTTSPAPREQQRTMSPVAQQRRESTLEEVVELNFESEKREATNNIIYSSNFELNQITQLKQDSDSNLTFMKKSKSHALDDCNTSLTHERNKHLFVLQTAKRIRDVMKHPQLETKSGSLLLLAMTLCKRAISMGEFVLNNLKNRLHFGTITEEGLQDFCSSTIYEKYLEGVKDDLKQARGFYDSLEAKVNEDWVKNIDRSVEAAVRDKRATEGLLYSTTDKLLVHMFIWEKKNAETLAVDLRRQLQLSLIGTHYTLNMNVEFPCKTEYEVFNWKRFFERMESMSEADAALIRNQHTSRNDEIGSCK